MSPLATKLRGAADVITNVVMNYSVIESKVRAATNSDPWGPSGTVMHELAKYTYSFDEFPEVMGMLWERMFDESGKSWRRYYKSLTLLSYLLRYGSENVVNNARCQAPRIQRLLAYNYFDEKNREVTANIHSKVHEVLYLAFDTERLRELRRRAKASQYNYVGLSYEDAKFEREIQEQRYFYREYIKSQENKALGLVTATASVDTPAQGDEHAPTKKEKISKIKQNAIKKIDLGAAKNFTGSANSTANSKTFGDSFGPSSFEAKYPVNNPTNNLLNNSVNASFQNDFIDFSDSFQQNDSNLSQPAEFGNFQSNTKTEGNEEEDPFVSLTHRFQKPFTVAPSDNIGAATHSLLQSGQADFANFSNMSSTPGAFPLSETNPTKAGGGLGTCISLAPVSEQIGDRAKESSSCSEFNAASSATAHSDLEKTPFCSKPNTWSNFKGVDINLDNLKIECQQKEERKLFGNKVSANVFSDKVPAVSNNNFQQSVPMSAMTTQNSVMGPRNPMMAPQYVMQGSAIYPPNPFIAPGYAAANPQHAVNIQAYFQSS